jgi:hypothetical protein
MLVDITKFVCSSPELVHKIQMLCFHRFLQWCIEGGCQVYALIAKMVLQRTDGRVRSSCIFVMW